MMWRRRNYLINRKYQTKFSIKFASLVVLEAAVLAVLFYFLSRGTVTAGYYGQEMKILKTSAFFGTQFWPVLLLSVASVAIFVAILFILHSHRIAGPIYRFEKDLGELKNGNFTLRLNLRKKDEFHELAQSLNAFAQQMDERLSRIKKETDQVQSATGSTASSELQQSVSRLKELVGQFKTSQ